MERLKPKQCNNKSSLGVFKILTNFMIKYSKYQKKHTINLLLNKLIDIIHKNISEIEFNKDNYYLLNEYITLYINLNQINGIQQMNSNELNIMLNVVFHIVKKWSICKLIVHSSYDNIISLINNLLCSKKNKIVLNNCNNFISVIKLLINSNDNQQQLDGYYFLCM